MEIFLVKISGFGIFARYFEARERIREKKRKKSGNKSFGPWFGFEQSFFPSFFAFPAFVKSLFEFFEFS